MGRYVDAFRRSLESPEEFWLEAAEAVDWTRKPTHALDSSRAPLYRWFPDGELNTCYNAVDRHVENGRGGQTALIWDSAVTQTTRSYTYSELREEVARFAGGLASLGVAKGDRVIIYMPMVPEAVTAMLACARLGAVHSVVFGGFAPKELAARVDDAKPKVIVAASCGIEPTRIVEYKPIIDAALKIASHQPDKIVILQRDAARAELDERAVDWVELMAQATPADPVPVAATDPLYILYTSGTTGRPKGVVRDAGGHRRGADLVDGRDLRHPSRRRVVDRLGCGLGRRAQLHRLRAAVHWGHHRAVRRQTRRHAGRRRVLAGNRRSPGEGAFHRAHGVARDQTRGPGRQRDREI